jgi:Cu/Ag efflux protein CusF
MKMYQLILLGLTASLAACGQKSTSDATVPTNGANKAGGEKSALSANLSNQMNGRAMPGQAAATTAKGTGVVTAIDRTISSITIDHQPIPEAQWPAMTMAFKVAPKLLDSVKVGDKVTFDLALQDGGGEVTKIQVR